MAQVSMTVRMDSQLKQNFDALCARMGMSANAAMNVFAKAVASIMNSDPKSFSNALIAELGVVFLVPSFIFAYRSFTDNEYYEKKKQEFEEMTETPEVEVTAE